MLPHAANLQFVETGRSRISFSNASCSVCHENYRVFSEKRSFKVRSHLSQRSPTFCMLFLYRRQHQFTDSVPDYAVPIAHDESAESRNSTLSNILNELKIHKLNNTPQLKHTLIDLIHRCQDAFSMNGDDIGQSRA